MTDTWCPIPWNFQAVRSNGDIRVCCQANITANKGVLRKQDGTPYNAATDDIAAARNADLIKTIRRNMMQGIWSDECQRCKTEESLNLDSRRIYERDTWKDITMESVRAHTTEDGTIDTDALPVTYYDLRFGNFCNLACRMCGPNDSTGWYDDWNKLWDVDYFQDTHGTEHMRRENGKWVSDSYSWHGSDEFWRQLDANSRHIKHVYMAGGEPLLIERHYEFLQGCIDRGHAKNIIIEYNTNCTSLPNRVLDMWSHFRQIRIGASIDGFGKILEYQRYPASWDKVYRNLQKINAGPANIVAWIAYTVTAYNILHLPDFMRWKLCESGLDRFNNHPKRPIVTHHMAHMPLHLNVRILPKLLKNMVTDKFDQFVDWTVAQRLDDNIKARASDIRNSVCGFMNTKNTYSTDDWHWFKIHTNKLDKIRGQDVFDVVPELRPWL